MSNNNKIQSIDPLVDKIMDKTAGSSYNKYIQNISEYTSTKSNKNTMTDFYNQFKPLDKILFKPAADNSYNIMRHLGYRSRIVGFIALVSVISGLYFIYDRKDNMSFLFLFFCFFISFFDKLYMNKLNNKAKNREMLSVLIKLTIHILLSLVLKLYIFNSNNCNLILNNMYLLIFMLVITIILTHHTEKIFKRKGIKSRKLLFVKRINIMMLLITSIYVINLIYKDAIDTSNNSIIDLFVQN